MLTQNVGYNKLIKKFSELYKNIKTLKTFNQKTDTFCLDYDF